MILQKQILKFIFIELDLPYVEANLFVLASITDTSVHPHLLQLALFFLPVSLKEKSVTTYQLGNLVRTLNTAEITIIRIRAATMTVGMRKLSPASRSSAPVNLSGNGSGE